MTYIKIEDPEGELTMEVDSDLDDFITLDFRTEDGDELFTAVIPNGEVDSFFQRIDQLRAEWTR